MVFCRSQAHTLVDHHLHRYGIMFAVSHRRHICSFRFFLLRRIMCKVKLVDKKLFVSAMKAAKIE